MGIYLVGRANFDFNYSRTDRNISILDVSINDAEKHILFFDCQTTGSQPATSNLLEVAWVSVSSLDQNRRVHFTSVVRQPEGYIVPRQIQVLTGIAPAEIDLGKASDEIYHELRKCMEIPNTVLVIHYARFELGFLRALFERFNDPLLETIPIYCTHTIGKRVFPALPSKGIRAFKGYFGLPLSDLKRAQAHVEATVAIWEGLLVELKKIGIENFSALDVWLNEKVETKKPKFIYPLAPEKRLSLPKVPGIYRMKGKHGNILYVGKATSLHARVNSYFRGQKNRDAAKLELLSQVWDLEVTECKTPLQAALLETDEIKKHNPPYNISLKIGNRRLLFYDRQFENFAPLGSAEFPLGPFTGTFLIDSLKRFRNAICAQDFSQTIFIDFNFEASDALMREGYALFCETHRPRWVKAVSALSVRELLAFGVQLLRHHPELIAATTIEDVESDQTLSSTDGLAHLQNDEITAQDVADKLARLLMRVAQSYLRTKKIARLARSSVRIQNLDFIPTELDIAAYDRLSILVSYLQNQREL